MTRLTQAQINDAYRSQHPDLADRPGYVPRVRTKARNDHPEHDIQCAIVKYLAMAHPKIYVCSSLAGVKLTKMQMIRAKAAGYRSGHPDLVLHAKDKTIYCEVKSAVGQQSDNQKDVAGILCGMGIPYYIVRSIDDVREVLKIENLS